MTGLFFITAGFSFLFSCLLPVQRMGLAAFTAFFIAAGFSAAFSFFVFKFISTSEAKYFKVFRKMFEYLVFVLMACFIISRGASTAQTPIMDAILAIIWFIILGLSLVSAFFISEKRLKKYFPNLHIEKNKKNFILIIVDWADAIVQAACIVLLVELFIFQLYHIPSESMVPEFMVGDRVFGVKFTAGPTFPVSSFRLPQFKNYKKGDIVIIRNPNYENEPSNELKFFLSQFVYMLTLTNVNINTDSMGRQKADPLVKRIVAEQGEKVMLVDGVLYTRKKGEKNFSPVDESGYAKWNLELLPKTDLKYVKDIKMDTKSINILESVESKRAAVDFKEALNEAVSTVKKIKEMAGSAASSSSFEFVNSEEYFINMLFAKNKETAYTLLASEEAVQWFERFMTDWGTFWKDYKEGRVLYEIRFAQLNALVKNAYGKLILRNAELISSNASDAEFDEDKQRSELLEELEKYYFYLTWTGQRNMNVFPAEPEKYIPEGCFFMMGDNRFNSTDMRHSYNLHKEPLDKNDPYPIIFLTNIEPKYVPQHKILGTVNFIFWPIPRAGRV